METAHVRVRHTPAFEQRAAQIAEISPTLIRRLENRLGFPFDLRPTVVPVADAETFRRLGGGPWFTAFAVPARQLVVLDMDRLDQDSGALYATLQHEYAHLLLHRFIDRGRLPRWLDEGVAQYVSDGLSEYLPMGRRPLLPQAAAGGRLFYLDELAGQFPADRWGLQLAYEQSRSIVGYLVRQYGEDALRRLLRALADGTATREAFRTVMGVDLHTAEDDWRSQLQTPGAWVANLAGQVYGLLFFAAALATVWGYLRFRHRKRHYRDDEDDGAGD